MIAQRLVGFSALLCVTASCASLNQPATKKPAPEDAGPKAYISATYTGGLLNRRVDPVFKVEQDAYVMVAHLGGDGQIEVLYPRDPRESGRVPAGKYFRTTQFSAYYDAAPQLYSFAMTHYRSLGARHDSYDGSGNGFVFLIASRFPLLFDRISSYGLWDDFEVDTYRWTADPRSAIGALAQTVSGGAAYTLRYATSYSSMDASSYADYLFDCAFFSFSNFGYFSPVSGFGGLPAGAWSYFASSGGGYFSGCPQSGYAYQSFANVFSQQPSFSPGTPGPGTPAGGGQTLTRPPGRRPGQPGPALGFNRPTFNRPTGTQTAGTQTAGYAPADRPGRVGGWGGRSSGFGDPRWGGTTPSAVPRSTPTYDAPRSAPRYDSPRYDSPRSTPSYDTPRSATPTYSQPAPQVSAPAPQPSSSSTTVIKPGSSGEEKKP